MRTKYKFQQHGQFVRAFMITCRLLDIVKTHCINQFNKPDCNLDLFDYWLLKQRQLELQVIFNAVRKYPCLLTPDPEYSMPGIQRILFERMCWYRDMVGFESVNNDQY